MKKLTAILIILILGMFFLPKKQEVKQINPHSVSQQHHNNQKASRFTTWTFNN